MNSETVKQTSQAFKQFSYIFSQAPTGMSLMGSKGEILEVNRKLCDMFGFSEAEFKTQSIASLTYPEDAHIGQDQREAFFKGDIDHYEVERRYYKQNGEVFWGLASITRLFDDNHEDLNMLLGSFQDVTARREADEQLELSEQLFSSAFLHAGVGMALLNAEGQILQVNHALCQFLSYSEEALKTMGFQDITHPEDLSRDQVQFDALVADEIKSYAMEKRYIDAGGNICWGALSVSLARDENGDIEYIIGQVQDIHAQKLAEQARREQNKLYTGAFSSAFTFMALLSPDGVMVDVNENAVIASGVDKDNLLDYTLDQGYWFRNLPEQQTKIRECLRIAQRGELCTTELVGDTVMGQLTIDFSLRPLLNEHGYVTHLIAEGRDITELKANATLLQQQSEALERQNQELHDFTYIASHDLQEPLRKVQTFGKRLEAKENLTERGKDYLARMNNSAERMQQMIQDLLIYSRVGTVKNTLESVSLNETFNAVKEALALRIEETDARITADDLPTVNAIPLQMHQVLQNLLGNALKFMPPGRQPEIHVGAAETETHHKIRVKDNGIGLRTEFADKIFQPFQRLHGRRDYSGSGIGLAICRKIIEHHGGNLSVESTPDEGSTFIFTLPKTPQHIQGVS